MHTVFINTTERDINVQTGLAKMGGAGLEVLKYEVQHKKIKYVNCPLKTWNNKNVGFENTVREVSRYIDTYNTVGNEFNLIIYADLREVAKYMGLPLKNDERAREGAIYVTYVEMVTRLFTETIHKCFCDADREPEGKFLLLLEQPKYCCPDDIIQAHGKEQYSLFEEERVGVVFELLGLLSYEDFVKKIEELRIVKQNGEECSVDDIMSGKKIDADFSFRDIYAKEIKLFFEDLVSKDINIYHKSISFCNSITEKYKSDIDNHVGVSEYYTKRNALNINMTANSKSSFLLQCFIWNCVNTQTLFLRMKNEEGVEVSVPKRIPEVSDEQWKKVCTRLAIKKKGLGEQINKIENDQTNYIDLKLAPPLYEVNFEKFGIDANGHLIRRLTLQNTATAVPEKKDKKEKKGKKNKDDKKKAKDKEKPNDENADLTKEISSHEQAQKMILEERRATSWLSDNKYDFYVEPAGDVPFEPDLSNIDNFQESALGLAQSSLSIVGDLNRRLAKNMSHYSAPSESNEPPLLRKRRVSADGKGQKFAKNDYKYAVLDDDGEPKRSEDPVEFLRPRSPVAYKTMALECLEFDSGRGIEIASVQEECTEFSNRIKSIKDCMAKTSRVCAIVTSLFAALFLIPFVGSQYKGIFENFNTLIIALLSLLVPAVFIAVGCFMAKNKQKREINKAWDELKDAYRNVNAENHNAIRSYDDLLTCYIPSLRWIYEYLLDIDFHSDCLDTAVSRFSHHKSVLNETIQSIDIILSFLGFDDAGVAAPTLQEGDYVDCSTSPYEGDNYSKYSIVDTEIINVIFEEGAGQ